MASLLDVLADPSLSFLAEQALAHPGLVAEYADRYKALEREHEGLRVKFASLVAAKTVGTEGPENRSDNVTALFENFKKTEQQVMRGIVNGLVQHVVSSRFHEISAPAQRKLRYEIMATLTAKLLLAPYRELMDETVLTPEQLAKLVAPLRKSILSASSVADRLSDNDPVLTELSDRIQQHVVDLVTNGLALLRSRLPMHSSTLAEIAANAIEVISVQYEIPSHATELLDELENAANSCVELSYQLTRSNVACLLWVPERNTPFNHAAHRATVGAPELGRVQLALFPGLTIGGRIVERALVLTERGNPFAGEDS